jgi:hypothetical protein
MSYELKARLQSFGWRLGMMILAVLIDFMLENLELMEFSGSTTVILGLVLGEVSKHLNNQRQGI